MLAAAGAGKVVHVLESLAAQVPYMVSIGNHEYDHEGGSGGRDPSGVTSDAASFWNLGDDSNGECGVPMSYPLKRQCWPQQGEN